MLKNVELLKMKNEKTTHGFTFSINMSNFVAFHWVSIFISNKLPFSELCTYTNSNFPISWKVFKWILILTTDSKNNSFFLFSEGQEPQGRNDFMINSFFDLWKNTVTMSLDKSISRKNEVFFNNTRKNKGFSNLYSEPETAI